MGDRYSGYDPVSRSDMVRGGHYPNNYVHSQMMMVMPAMLTDEEPSNSAHSSPGPMIKIEVGSPSSSMMSEVNTLCSICGDRATGKHYGASSCDGCKGFFRRSVRKKQTYQCRFQKRCEIDKDKRNQCRHCRLQKCRRSGMRIDSVQRERDTISNKRMPPPQKATERSYHDLSVKTLLNADMMSGKTLKSLDENIYHRESPIKRQLASIADIADSMRQQLLVLVDWAKFIPVFAELELDDQVALLRARAGEHLLLGVARRSLDAGDLLLLGNRMFIPTREKEYGLQWGNETQNLMVHNIGNRVMRELVDPFRKICVDDTEFACLKAIVFFDPNASGLKDKEKIDKFRQEIQVNLEDYISDRQYDMRGRFGGMLLTLTSLQSITGQMIEKINEAKKSGITQIDNLLQEMLLATSSVASGFPPTPHPPQQFQQIYTRQPDSPSDDIKYVHPN